jgi:hypothetical protein
LKDIGMSSDPPVPPAVDVSRGLPPVSPPSGRFIVQLFLVPGLIVAVAVLILLGFKFLVGGTRTADEFLRSLDSSNPDVRWRAASDLAQVLKRPESLALASDPKFGLDLAERLQAGIDEIKKDEAAALKQSSAKRGAERESAWHALAPKRNYVLFLSACLGNMTIPVGAPILCEMATDAQGADPKGVALRRRRAVWSLANLGDNLSRFRELSEQARHEASARLEREAKGDGSRAKWAQATLAYFRDKKSLGVDRALASAARPPNGDPYLRELVAFALKYWEGDEVEGTLTALADDAGKGTTVEVGEDD